MNRHSRRNRVPAAQAGSRSTSRWPIARRASALAPTSECAKGERCCEPVVYLDVEREHVIRLAKVVRALGDPIRLQLVDVLHKHGKVCVCALVPLFDVSQPTLSHHLKKLRGAGLVDFERQGQCAYYRVTTAALDVLSAGLC